MTYLFKKTNGGGSIMRVQWSSTLSTSFNTEIQVVWDILGSKLEIPFSMGV